MTTTAPAPVDPAESAAAKAAAGNPLKNLFSELTRSMSGFLGFVLVLLILVMTAVAPWVRGSRTPGHDWLKPTDLYGSGPSGHHPLGTSGQGIDVLALTMNGGKTVLYVGFLAAGLCVLIAVALGSLAAYFRGWLDAVMLQITDVVMTIPQIVLLAVMGAFFRLNSPTALGILIGVLSWPVLMRSIRAQVLSLKEREFVEAARLLDLGWWRIVFIEIVPNMASFIMINFIIAITNAIYALVGLYVLGLAPLYGANWGIMIQDAWSNGSMTNPDAMWYILAPVGMIVLLQLGLILLTRTLEEILNPRLRDR